MERNKGRCAGCGGAFDATELAAGEENTRWCAGCIREASALMRAPRLAPEHRVPRAFDHIQEDDGEP